MFDLAATTASLLSSFSLALLYHHCNVFARIAALYSHHSRPPPPAIAIALIIYPGVGKSSIVLRFVTDTFTDEYLPTIEDCYRKTVHINGKTSHLDILDTAGQEEFSSARDDWVRDGKVSVLGNILYSSRELHLFCTCSHFYSSHPPLTPHSRPSCWCTASYLRSP